MNTRLLSPTLLLLSAAVSASAATAPVANADTVVVHANTTVALNVLANDVAGAGPLAVISATTPAHGSVVLENGRVRYTPTVGYTGSDSFTYTIRDGVSIGAVSRAPLATFGGVTVFGSGFGSSIAPVPGSTTDFYIMTDRGPNVGGTGTNKVFPVPTFAPQIARVTPNASGGGYRVTNIITFKRPAGAPALTVEGTPVSTLTGLPNTFNPTAGIAVKAGGAAITPATDDYGFDSEGLVALADGTFWVSDEYGPYICHFAADGTELERIAPSSLNISGLVDHSAHSLPKVLNKRFENKGMEALTITPDGTKLVGMMQSPLDNLLFVAGTADVKKGVANRIVVYDLATGVTQQYVYLLDRTSGGSPNTTVCEISAITNRKFLVDERDSKFANNPGDAATVKRIYEIDLDGGPGGTVATDITDATDGVRGTLYVTGTKTLEDLTYNISTAAATTALAGVSVQPVAKRLVLDLLALGNGNCYQHDKIEGLAVLSTTTDATYGTVAARIAISNDDDFGVTDAAPAADTPAAKVTPQGLIDHNEILTIDLSNSAPLAQATVSITVADTPYLLPVAPGVQTKGFLSVGESVNLKPDGFSPYRMIGIPNNLGLFDNNDGTFTLLSNHEIEDIQGTTRAHGKIGAFVSKWIVNKSTLQVQQGADLIQTAYDWNDTAYVASTAPFHRFCSADLPATTALYNAGSNKGTTHRIFLDGEERSWSSVTVPAGRGMAHVVDGPDAGKSWELPLLGRVAFENALVNPLAQDKTIVMTSDDSGRVGATPPSEVNVYIGTKLLSTGTELDIEKAGFTNGHLYGVKVTGKPVEDLTTTAPYGVGAAKGVGVPFTLAQYTTTNLLTDDKQALQAEAITNAVTQFSRVEDGAWDPLHPADYYFITTDIYDQVKDGVGSQVGRSRLWRLRFTDITAPENGGTIAMMLDGTEPYQMLDNLTVDTQGRILLEEDVGNAAHNGKIWVYNIASGSLTMIAKHDRNLFGDLDLIGSLTKDEEGSGIIDAAAILGTGWYLTSDQAHYNIGDAELVEGGQYLALFVPPVSTLTTPPTIAAIANQAVADGGTTPAIAVTVSDAETPASSLVVTRTSSNTALVPLANVLLSGNGSARTVTVTVVAGVTGSFIITLMVNDGDGGTTTFSFTVSVNVASTISNVSD
ncbi:MAG TPA: esterase-like activity of phytase family protein, partial [Planctomycetota bacterium]|nr:esterase-like activity of phytase family protein [Planctomycetota bacterium]